MFQSLLLLTPLGSRLEDTLLPGRWRWGWEWLVLDSGRRTLLRASVDVTLTLMVRLWGKPGPHVCAVETFPSSLLGLRV